MDKIVEIILKSEVIDIEWKSVWKFIKMVQKALKIIKVSQKLVKISWESPKIGKK